MTRKNLPPLEVGTAYQVADFEGFEYSGPSLAKLIPGVPAGTAILHLHLKNKTTLEIPAAPSDLQFLMRNLMAAYPKEAIAFAKDQKWISP